ncbi:PREDICTED: G-type lectin S-receptor-like serine/threonine-protein kinase RKS1 [Brassica oleracea var. oleracea]|uniref:Receptor-like serine/threonine-protein kinase n=1 Tax=Brassica oleracea var. oleracea TaxID=109376 RepID=A0A0D3C9A8_BRAOL|nr:PREDICTED: G-type lectin S-receptor-like serine/threonine-protein kinase RKS1 [Brassica oleracea var. oleracea]
MKIAFFNFFFFFCLLQSCTCDDTIMRTQSMRDGDVIFSEGKRFAFGFFSLGVSNLRYVGIWYAQVSEQTVVWVANRDRPMNDTSGVIRFSSSGNLCIYASVNTTEPLWSTNVTESIPEPTLVARLSALGNLVLLDSVTGKGYWESFDHPTDSSLPFMRLGFTRKDGLDRVLTSWKSPGDPASGTFSLRINRTGFPQLILYKGVTPWWRTGSWTGLRWSGLVFQILFVNNQDEVSMTNRVMDASVITRMMVNETGKVQRLTWSAGEKRWNVFWSIPKEECDNYAHCGLNGYCRPTSSEACTCLPGFEPKMPRDWLLRDYTGGCSRRNKTSLCREKEGFVKFTNAKIPDTSVARVDMNITLKECKQRCLRNCSCLAYASAYHEGVGGEKGCLTWHGDMLDTRSLLNSGQDFYIRVDREELERWNKNGSLGKRRAIIIVISLIAALMLLAVISFCFVRKRRKSNRDRRSSTTLPPGSFDISDTFRFEEEQGGREWELPLFELNTIATATNNFDFRNKLGEGGFGPVYKGVLENGMEIAVKRLSKNSGQGMEEFKNEVKLISKLQHRNLVRMLGCCVESEEKMLVYEYLPNKSLDYFIFHEEQRAELDWPKRMEIICGIARGILYLHQDSRLRIIHRDLKASNVLLDNEMIPKIADFGMARIFGGKQIRGSTNRVVGTYGYMSPEYAMEGHFSVKSDVYSFGVLILEIITGKKNSAFHKESLNLVGQIWDLWNKGEATAVIDKLMNQDINDESEVMKCVHIGLLCVQENASDRPDMPSVVSMFGHNANDFPPPKHPAFTSGRKPHVKNDDLSGENSTSVNDVTLTDVYGR